MRPTMRQVAERAGVSQVTVTNVLRGREDRTSAETRERVLRAVNELGYMPVAQPASQQRHVKTNVIGVTYDQIDALEQMGLVFLKGLRDGAARHGYDLLLMLRPAPDWAPNREEVRFLDRRSDGFIFVAPLGRQKVLRALVKNEIPVVSCSSIDVPDGVATVCADNHDEVRQAVRYLKEYGHSRIMHIAGPKWNSDERSRAEGFAPAMREEGLGRYADWMVSAMDNDDWHAMAKSSGKGTVRSADYFFPGYENFRVRSAEEIFEDVRRIGATGVVCCNDGVAVDLWQCAEKSGWKVPRDLSIVGINDTTYASEAGLTSVNMNLADMGIAAVESWIQLQAGASYQSQSKVTPVRLVERASVAAPSRKGHGLRSRKRL